MDSSFDNNWYDRLVELNIGLAQSTTITACDLHLQEVCCNALKEKANDLKREVSKLEDDYEFKRVKLNNILQMDEMLQQNLDSLDDLIATKEFCLQIMQENYEQKQKNIKENDKLASSIIDKFERNYKKSKENFDKCSLAKKYHKLQNAVLERKIRMAILRKKIEDQKAKNKLRSDIQRKLKQQKIIKLAEVMVKYYAGQKNKSNVKKCENDSEKIQIQPKSQEVSSQSLEDVNKTLIKDADTNLTRMNYEEIINLLQFKITDYRPANKLNISINQDHQSAILKDNNVLQCPVLEKQNTMNVTLNNSNYIPANTNNLSIENIAMQSARLNTDIITNSPATETTDNSITASSGHVSVSVTDANAALYCVYNTDCTGDTEHITVSRAVQNIDKHIPTEEIQTKHVDNGQMQPRKIEELNKDKLDEINSDFISSLQEEQQSTMPNEEINRIIIDNSITGEEKEEFNIDTDLLQYKTIDAPYISNDNEYEIPTFKPVSQQSSSSPSSVISFAGCNAEENTGISLENIPTNTFNLFAIKKDEDKTAEPFKFTFNQPVGKPNTFFNMF